MLFNKAKDTISESKSQLGSGNGHTGSRCLIKPKIQFLKANHNQLYTTCRWNQLFNKAKDTISESKSQPAFNDDWKKDGCLIKQ